MFTGTFGIMRGLKKNLKHCHSDSPDTLLLRLVLLIRDWEHLPRIDSDHREKEKPFALGEAIRRELNGHLVAA